MLVVENIEDQNIKKKKKVNQVYMYIHIHTINVFYIMNCTIIYNYYKCSLITISHIIIIHVYLFMSMNINLDYIFKLFHNIFI